MLTPQNIQLDVSAYPHSGACQISLPRAGLHPTLPRIRGQQVKLESYLGYLAQGQRIQGKMSWWSSPEEHKELIHLESLRQ